MGYVWLRLRLQDGCGVARVTAGRLLWAWAAVAVAGMSAQNALRFVSYQSATVVVCMHHAQRRLQVKQHHGTTSHPCWTVAARDTPQDWVGRLCRLANPGCQRYTIGLRFSYAYAAKLRSILDAEGQTLLCFASQRLQTHTSSRKYGGINAQAWPLISPVLSCSHGLYCIRSYVDVHAYRHQAHSADALVSPILRCLGRGLIFGAGIGAS